MDIGIKIFPEDLEYAKRIAKYCDFFEVMAVPKSNFRAMKAIGKPFTIHTIHSHWGFNPTNPEKRKLNLLGVDTAAKAADILGADVIVVHPGQIESEKCSLEHAVSFISKLDSRFVVENMPSTVKEMTHVGCDISDLKQLTKKPKRHICLDFPHAAEYAHSQGIEYTSFINSLIDRFGPRYFHISDTRIQNRVDMHLHLKEGDLKLWYFKKIIPKNARLLIETAHEFRKQHRDILLLKNHE
jgi:endonuclease IV